MTSDRHGARAGRAPTMGSRCTRVVVLALGGACLGGCFGDWVSARPRPRQGTVDEGSPALDAGARAQADPCGAYLRAVAERCDAILDGQWSSPGCYVEIVRVMALHRDVSIDESRDERCTQLQQALEPVRPPSASTPELGPQCEAWAQALRERCVAPLASVPPDLRRCGGELATFESTLGAITFGRPQDYEAQCRDAVERQGRAEQGRAEQGKDGPG